jgi:hypothetical protein|tara:strand:- start:835 stop:1116 length:282 start_codon:yes stop_codon:yes gene_type:complete
MKMNEITEIELDTMEAKPTPSYCKKTPRDEMSASWKASCKSQGLTRREGKKSHKKPGGNRETMGGKKLKGQAHGGWLPDYGSGSKTASKKKKS